ncbi:MAG: PaaI family thioesterase [Kiritimatiellae bacterium]|nr:PaaI family thioesterase [Kiritimatiellia bacterium]
MPTDREIGMTNQSVRLKSPFTGVKGDKCFGCSQANPHGLHLEFFEEGDEVVCRWRPDPRFQSWDGVLHGGITATILDETAGWTAMRRFQRTAMTTRLEVRYLKPVLVDGVIVARARYLKQVNEKIARFVATIENADGVILSEAEADYYIMDEERSRAMGFTSL